MNSTPEGLGLLLGSKNPSCGETERIRGLDLGSLGLHLGSIASLPLSKAPPFLNLSFLVCIRLFPNHLTQRTDEIGDRECGRNL